MDECKALIKATFFSNAWAYTVMYHGVAIGTWRASEQKLDFCNEADFCWDDVLELRVFDTTDGIHKELRFVRNEDGELLSRDSDKYNNNVDYEEYKTGDTAEYLVQDTHYLMYGTDATDGEDGWTILTEDRGGSVYFPKALDFKKDESIVMWLGIRNYLRFTEDLRLEVCDYAFMGFKKGLGKQEVKVNG